MVKNLRGLSADEVRISREKNGDNGLAKQKTKGFLRKFLENLSDPIIKVLIAAVIVEIIFTFGHCNWLETMGIIIAVLIATTVSTVSEYGSEIAFSKMQEENSKGEARVLRDGIISRIPISEIVVGDVIYLSAGEVIPADGSIVSGRMTLDQSALNGESVDALKYPKRVNDDGDLSSEGMLFRGSSITSGEGIMRVERVGAATYYGLVAKDVQTETRVSPLKLRLSHLAKQISRLGYIMAIIVGLTYLFYAYVVDNSYDLAQIINSFKNIPFVITSLTHALTLMITVVVVAVPEGLPMMITVVLSANMKKMLRDNVMVKKLVGIETAGSMNILCTDKTGTLTTGKTACDCIITSLGNYKSAKSLRKCGKIFDYLNLSAKFGADVNQSLANSTDKALDTFFKNEPATNAVVVSKIPFSSEKKYSSITLKSGVTIVKGAPELILSACKYSINCDGEMYTSSLKEIHSEFRSRAMRGERVIAVAITDGRAERMAFVALVVLKDRVRPGVKAAVEQVNRAGVRVVMITGDSKETAAAIAAECGILHNSSMEGVISHSELEKMNDDELKAILPNLKVVARALPQDKTRLVRVSQELDLVVGMTGDGINDAPSLKLADIGFAMGSGTDIAKGAADVVILDDSFFAIAKTILYGRTIFKSIRKFITFQLMMNLTACGVSLLGQFIGIENPITIIQMLWINIIMDTLGGLAFSGEPPLEYYMMEKPKAREEKILSKEMLHGILLTGGYTLILCVCFLFFDFFRNLFRPAAGDAYFLTGFYALFVFSGIFNCFNARSERMWLFSNIGKNKPFMLIMLLISVIQILMIYFGGDVFRSAPLSFRELLNVILLSATVTPFDMMRRIFKKLSK